MLKEGRETSRIDRLAASRGGPDTGGTSSKRSALPSRIRLICAEEEARIGGKLELPPGLAPHPAVGTVPHRLPHEGGPGEARRGNRIDQVRRQGLHVERRVVELLGIGPPEPHDDPVISLGGHRSELAK